MSKTKEEIIDMSRYIEAETIDPKCEGCEKVFDYTAPESTIVEQKCRIYPRPSAWWRERSVATKQVLVRDKANPKGIIQELPAISIRCPAATHIEPEPTANEPKINPLKASKRRRR